MPLYPFNADFRENMPLSEAGNSNNQIYLHNINNFLTLKLLSLDQDLVNNFRVAIFFFWCWIYFDVIIDLIILPPYFKAVKNHVKQETW